MRFSTRVLSFAAILAATVAADAEITYHVAVKPDEKKIAVEIAIPVKAGDVDVQMPSWMPGAYAYGDFYENVKDVTATGPKGEALTVRHPDKNTWRVVAPKSGKVTFSYWISTVGNRRFGGGPPDSTYVQISGPATYMYVVGRKTEPCKISFDVPASWPLVTGLDSAKGGPNTYKAPTYDVLADNPVSTGNIIIDQYKLRGKDHYVVLEGAAKDKVDQTKLVKDCRFVSAAETDFFGGAPYHKYVWHFTVFPGTDGAGGLEHLSSTQISLASGEGPRAQSVLAHEYFHLWNVKRIRAFPLGPFDYLTLPKTGALWWLEGVTDYYAAMIPYRYGEWKRSMFYDAIVTNTTAVRNNPAYSEIGPNEASLRVSEAENGRGNSNGFKISYYNLGWLGGFCLDTEIRAQTNNHHSLDDVVRALYELCKDNKPGFEEDEIRKQCIRFGGPSLGPFYDKVILQAGHLPIEAQLGKMGLEMTETDEPFVDIGFAAAPVRGGKGLRVSAVHANGAGKLGTGDIIFSLNGQNLDTDDMMTVARAMPQLQSTAVVGQAISLKVKRGDGFLDVVVSPVSSTRKVHAIQEDPAASKNAIALREGWLKTKAPSAM